MIGCVDECMESARNLEAAVIAAAGKKGYQLTPEQNVAMGMLRFSIEDMEEFFASNKKREEDAMEYGAYCKERIGKWHSIVLGDLGFLVDE